MCSSPLTEGVRFVLRPDALGRLFAELICAVWFAVAFFAFEYMNHEGHRERFFGFYLLTLGALMGGVPVGQPGDPLSVL